MINFNEEFLKNEQGYQSPSFGNFQVGYQAGFVFTLFASGSHHTPSSGFRGLNSGLVGFNRVSTDVGPAIIINKTNSSIPLTGLGSFKPLDSHEIMAYPYTNGRAATIRFYSDKDEYYLVTGYLRHLANNTETTPYSFSLSGFTHSTGYISNNQSINISQGFYLQSGEYVDFNLASGAVLSRDYVALDLSYATGLLKNHNFNDFYFIQENTSPSSSFHNFEIGYTLDGTFTPFTSGFHNGPSGWRNLNTGVVGYSSGFAPTIVINRTLSGITLTGITSLLQINSKEVLIYPNIPPDFKRATIRFNSPYSQYYTLNLNIRSMYPPAPITGGYILYKNSELLKSGIIVGTSPPVVLKDNLFLESGDKLDLVFDAGPTADRDYFGVYYNLQEEPFINLENVELLGLNHTFQFWGERYNYRNIQEYSVQSRFNGTLGLEKVNPLWKDIRDFTGVFTGNVYPIAVNGTYIGDGRVTQFSTQESTQVRDQVYNLSFQILKSGNASGINIPDLKYVNEFSSSTEYSRDKMDIYSYSRNVSLLYDKSYTGASNVITNVLNYTNPIPSVSQYFPSISGNLTSTGLIKNTSQNLDRINGRFNYSESLTFQPGQNYSFEYEHSLNRDEGGVSSVTERGTIRSLAYSSGSRIAAAEAAWSGLYPFTFNRVNGFYQRWKTSGDPNLIDYPLTKSTTKDKNKGEITYDWTYTNDISQKTGITYSYETSIEKQVGGYISVRENGEIRSLSRDFNAAWSYFSGVKTGIRNRSQVTYTEAYPFFTDCTGVGTLKQISTNETFREWQGMVGYDYEFTDDPTYYSTGKFKRIAASISDNKSVHIVNTFGVTNEKEVAQPALQNTPGVYSVSVEVIGTGALPVSDYLSGALTKVSPPSGVYNYYISDESYSLNPFTNTFNFRRDYTYSRYNHFNVNIV